MYTRNVRPGIGSSVKKLAGAKCYLHCSGVFSSWCTEKMDMSADDLQAIAVNWLKSLEVASSTGDTTSFVNHFLPGGWLRGAFLLLSKYTN